MYGLYIDDVKGTCSPITDTMCVKYKKKKNLLLFWACKSRAVTAVDGVTDWRKSDWRWVYKTKLNENGEIHKHRA